MPERNPILITGAAGEIGAVSRTVIDMLLKQGHPVRAFVRRDDERAHSLRQAGGEVFVGDVGPLLVRRAPAPAAGAGSGGVAAARHRGRRRRCVRNALCPAAE